jgi:hypothetical protein
VQPHDRDAASLVTDHLEIGRQRRGQKPFEEAARKSADRRAGKGP